MMSDKHPCDSCNEQCDGCFWYIRYNKRNSCDKYDCMYNYEDTCVLEIYDECNRLIGKREKEDE